MRVVNMTYCLVVHRYSRLGTPGLWVRHDMTIRKEIPSA